VAVRAKPTVHRTFGTTPDPVRMYAKPVPGPAQPTATGHGQPPTPHAGPGSHGPPRWPTAHVLTCPSSGDGPHNPVTVPAIPLTVLLRNLQTASQKAMVVGVNRGLGTVAQAQASQDAGEMVLHRALGQEQARRDLAVRRAARNQAQDVGLPGGQLAWLPRLDGDCPVGRAGYRLGQDLLRWDWLGQG
jgi:hypothetical protein